MSSEMFMFDEPFYLHLSLAPEMLISSEISSNFFDNPLSDSSIDTIFNHEISSAGAPATPQISADESHSLDQIAHTLFSNSPPSHQLETLSLSHHHQQTHLGNLANSADFATGSGQHSVSDVKTEDFHLAFENQSYFPGSENENNNGDSNSNLIKFMQRSYSSKSFEQKSGFIFQPSFDALVETQNNLQEFIGGHMRRVCSTGDLPEVLMNQTGQQQQQQQREGSLMEEGNFKVGRYNAEERRERIDRYRAKRTQRNFNKTIKYACRKTLADNRPRIRGRFARNDESGEIPKPTSSFHPYEDDDDLWVDNSQEEQEEDGILGRGRRFLSNFGGGTHTHHFQYCGY